MNVLSGEPEKSLRESKAATRLHNRVSSMINRLDEKLQKEKEIREEKIIQAEAMEKLSDDDKYDEFRDFKKEK